jgi:hypothetical protein
MLVAESERRRGRRRRRRSLFRIVHARGGVNWGREERK